MLHASFFVTGTMFWLQTLPSRPFRRRWVSILTNHSWFDVYAHVPGVRLPPFDDQQVGTAIRWVCGNFWAIPSFVYVARRVMDEKGGSLSSVVETWLRRVPATDETGWSRTVE